MIDPSDAVVIMEGHVSELERTVARLSAAGIEAEVVSPGTDKGSS
jgi:hypothetical protein